MLFTRLCIFFVECLCSIGYKWETVSSFWTPHSHILNTHILHLRLQIMTSRVTISRSSTFSFCLWVDAILIHCTSDNGAHKVMALAAPHKPSNDENDPCRIYPLTLNCSLIPSNSPHTSAFSKWTWPSCIWQIGCSTCVFIFFIFIYTLIICNKLPTVNEKQEAARQKAELKRHRAERQKLKAMKQVIPGSDDEDEELNERPNTMVCA